MYAKSSLILAMLFALPSLFCQAAPGYNGYQYNNYPTGYNNSPTTPTSRPTEDSSRQMRTALTDLKNEVNNHEIEIRTFESRLNNQETILESVRQQLTDTLQSQQDLSHAQVVNLESKVDSLDSTLKGSIADMRLMKNQSNEFVQILSQYKQKLSEFEKLIDAQNQHMKNLECALNSIMEVLQARDASEKVLTKPVDSPKTYKVQPGDSLEKIARVHKVPVQALRDLNKLNQDRIIVGQTLKIP